MSLSRLSPILVVGILGAACGEPATLHVAFGVPVHWYRSVALALEDAPDAPVTVIWDTLPGQGGGAGGAVFWAEWHVAQGADVVVGHDASRPSVGAAAVYNREQIVQIAPVATSGLLERQGVWSFGLVPNGAYEGRFMAAFADSVLGARRVALMYNNDEFGLDLRAGVTAAAADRGMTVVDERYFSPIVGPTSLAELEPVFAAALRSRPDVVVIAARHVEVVHLMRYLARRADIPAVIAGDGATIRSPGDRAWGPATEGLYVVQLWNPSTPAARDFVARFEARYGEPPVASEALTYEAARLVLAAAAEGARTAPEVRSWLLDLGRARPPRPGLSTEFAFQDGRPFRPALWMARIRGGALTVIEVAP